MTEEQNKHNPAVVDAHVLLGLIGILAFILPIVLYLVGIYNDDCKGVQGSISAYYFTNSRDALVGIIYALSFALLSYNGYSEPTTLFNDAFYAKLAAIFAFCVALFPTSVDQYEASECIAIFDNGMYSRIHYASAILLFLTLAYFCIFRFTKTDWNKNFFEKGEWKKTPDNKKASIKFYLFCGVAMVVCMILAYLYISLEDGRERKNMLSAKNPIFWLESVMLWLFSAAWLRKGKFFGLIKDMK